MNRSTIETLRKCLVELRALGDDMEERGLIEPLPRPRLQVIEGGATWVRNPEKEE